MATGESERQEKVRKALAALQKKHGTLTPRIVVDAARNKLHPLHDEFIWVDAEAADQQRLDRARHLIRYITITVITSYSKKARVPVYVKDVRLPSQEQGYTPLTTENLDRDAATKTLLAEFTRCESAIERARGVAHVLDSKCPGLSEKLESMLMELITLRGALDRAA